MPASLIKQVADYCWSKSFLDVFRKYFEDHADRFIGAPEICGGEHNMEYYALYQDYLKVYENTLTGYLVSINCSVEELYREVAIVQNDPSHQDAYLMTFIDCLLASCDYESFYKVMVKEGKKRVASRPRASLGAAGSGGGVAGALPRSVGSPTTVDAKAEAKWSDRDSRGIDVKSPGGGGAAAAGAKDVKGESKLDDSK